MAEFTPSFALIVWAPTAVLGTVKVALKPPEALDIIVVGEVVRTVLSYCKVIVAEAANPEPVTVTVVAVGPLFGDRVIAAARVKMADAVFELESVITTVWGPAVEAGTVKVAPVNEPELFVPVVPLNVTGIPPNVAVNDFEIPKPVPETRTVKPTFPVVGFRKIVGKTVKVAAAV